MAASIHDLLTDRVFNGGANCAHKRFAADRAAELLAEDSTRTAQDLVDLLREEADAARVEFDQLRGDD